MSILIKVIFKWKKNKQSYAQYVKIVQLNTNCSSFLTTIQVYIHARLFFSFIDLYKFSVCLLHAHLS